MHAPADAPAQPIPAGVACYQCAYELAGLAPEGVCPECGLAISASWPVWDLRDCHPVYVEHVRAEVRAMLAGAILATVAAGTGVVAAVLAGVPGRGRDPSTPLIVAGLGAVLAGLGAVGALMKVAWLVERHPGGDRAPGGPCRWALRRAACVAGVGVFVPYALAVVVAMASVPLAIAIALAGAVAGGVGLAMAATAAMRSAQTTLERAGKAAAGPAPGVGVSGRGAAGLGLGMACAVLVPMAAFGVTPLWWAPIPALAGLGLWAGDLALRLARARRVLEALIDSSG